MTLSIRTKRYGAALLAAAATTATLLGTPSAGAVGAGVAQSTLVSAVPSTTTPNVSNGTVYAITRVGSLTFLGGNFTQVQNPGSGTTYTRNNVLAFTSSTGAVSTTFAPALDGSVQALAPGPVANTVYVGGYFNTVNGVRSKGITLLSTTTGAIVSGFKPPALNGPVQTIASSGGHLIIGGGFTLAGALTKQGIASLNPTSGAVDPFMNVQLQGHHNWNGSGAKGALGARAMAVNPAGTRLMVVGNFKTANNLVRDQIVMIDINGGSAVVDPNWATLKYTAACYHNSFDTYVTDVQYAPDGSYFAVTATGGTGTNSDGSKALCDSAARWGAADTGSNVAPAWIDFTGTDTLWSVAVTGSAVYVGGHQRWLNNSNASDTAGPGAVPRPGLAALDPISGTPLSWNPGRNPRGAGAYALLPTSDGLYVGSDTDYFGAFRYKRQKIGFFPLAGGVAPAPTTVATLPSRVYMAGALAGQDGLGVNDLGYRAVNGTTIGTTTKVTTSLSWSTSRGAFVVGNTLFYGSTSGNFYRASFNGTSVGASVTVDPYNDPAWSSVQTGSGQTYRGVKPGYYSELSSVTGAFYSRGRMFYTLAGQRSLYWRWFSPDSGVVGADEFTITGADFRTVNGITSSGSSLYYAKTDGTLHTMSFANLTLNPASDTVFSGPAKDGRNWRARSLFLYGTA